MNEELRRERLHDSVQAADPHVRQIVCMFLRQDGSTTRLCEAVAKGPVSVRVLHQETVGELPERLRGMLPGTRFLRRVAALETRGEVMLDSLSYIALEVLPTDVLRELEAAETPIGHLLARLWTRREFHRENAEFLSELWSCAGMPDAEASRSYTVFTPKGPCMLIAETLRGGIIAGASARRPKMYGH